MIVLGNRRQPDLYCGAQIDARLPVLLIKAATYLG